MYEKEYIDFIDNMIDKQLQGTVLDCSKILNQTIPQSKPRYLTVEFDVKKRSMFDRLLNRKGVKSFMVKQASQQTITFVKPMLLKLIDEFDLQNVIRIISLLMTNESGIKKKAQRIEKFLVDNAQVHELKSLVQLLIVYNGDEYIMETIFPKIKEILKEKL